jgi:hypothetical protein
MRPIYIVLSAFVIGFAACNNTENSNTATGDGPPKVKAPAQSKLSSEGTQMLMDVTTRYYALKNALVATKAPKVDSAAIQLSAAADNMQAFLQKDSANFPALKTYVDTIVRQSKAITGIKDESCEKQRIEFEHLSSAMYGLLKAVDMKNAGVYHTYCPMAFNDKGAFWLSEESEVKNPYFGAMMLECGEVTDSF